MILLQLDRNGDPSNILNGTSTLINGMSGDILESQPAIAETGKGVASGAVSFGSKIVGEVSKQPQIAEEQLK